MVIRSERAEAGESRRHEAHRQRLIEDKLLHLQRQFECAGRAGAERQFVDRAVNFSARAINVCFPLMRSQGMRILFLLVHYTIDKNHERGIMVSSELLCTEF